MKLKDDNWRKYIQIGIELAFYVLIFSLIGIFLDIKLKTKPFFTILGILFSIFSIFYILWKKFIKDKNE